MNTAKNVSFWIVFSAVGIAALSVQAATVNYTLDNVILEDNTQMTGTFSWTYDIGDYENGVGQFSSLDIPWTAHNQDDLDATIEVTQSIEITLEGSVHDDGVDITLVLRQPLTPTTSSLINLVESKYEIGGNGFHDGLFQSGTVSPITGDMDLDGDVDSRDLNLLLSNFEAPPGSLDLLRLEILLTNFDRTDLPIGNPVPEPHSVLLLAMGIIGLLMRLRGIRK